MATKNQLGKLGEKGDAFFACSFVLMFFGLGALMLQGGIWLLVSSLSWCGVIFCCFIHYNYRYNRKYLKVISLNHEHCFEEDESKVMHLS